MLQLKLQYIYEASLVAILAATTLTASAIFSPAWTTYNITTSAGERLRLSIGLHTSCSNLRPTPCIPFPDRTLCETDSEGFCSAWKTVGFLGYLSVILLAVCAICAAIIVAGPPKRREIGWRVLVPGLAATAMVQGWAIVLVEYALRNMSVFRVDGWQMGKAGWWVVASLVVAVVSTMGLGVATVVMDRREGHITLDDPVLREEANGERPRDDDGQERV